MPAHKYFENYTGAGGVPSELTAVVTGAGSVSIVSDHLRVRTGGTGSTDMAFAYFNQALNMSAFTVIYGEVKFSGEVGAYNPNLIGLYDYSGNPVGVSTATRDANRRMNQEYQISSGADIFDRIQLIIKDGAADTKYNYIASTNVWQTAFANTRDNYDVGSYYRFVIMIDGTSSPKQMRSLVYGTNDRASGLVGGWFLNYDSGWLDIGTSAGEIDPVDNSLWLLLGDPTDTHASRIDVTYDFRRVMVAELVAPYLGEIGYSNRSDGGDYNYSIMKRLNPMPSVQTTWIPRWRQIDTADYTEEIARGSDDYVKDPHVYYDGTTYWMFTQRDNAGEGEIEVQSLTEPISGSWGSATAISVPDTGEDKHNFPWVTKYGGTWYLFYGVELDSGAFEIQYKTTTQTNPTSGWSSATTILTAGAGGRFDDGGVNACFLVWHSGTFTGGTWYMIYAGYDGANVWKTGLAKSTTGITGTYTRVSEDAILGSVTTNSTFDGTQNNVKQITVISTTGMVAGELYTHVTSPARIFEILSVDSSTLITVAVEMTVADTIALSNFYRYSNHIRYAFLSDSGYWVISQTQFKFPAGSNESHGIYVDTTGNLDLADCSFRPIRVGDSAIDAVYPHWNIDVASDENIGTIWQAMTDPVASPAALEINHSPGNLAAWKTGVRIVTP